METSSLGRRGDGADTGAEIARTVKEHVGELNKLLDAWSAKLAHRLEQVSPQSTPLTTPVRTQAWAACCQKQGEQQPTPPERLTRDPLPPFESSPPWQPHTGGSDSEYILPVDVSRPSLVSASPTADMPDIPGVIESSNPAPKPPPVLSTPSGGTKSRPTSPDGQPLGPTTAASGRLSSGDDQKLMDLAGGLNKAQKGRTMMQLYDLTSKFDRKAMEPLDMLGNGALSSCVHSRAFVAVSAFLIFLNAILIGVQMNSDVVNAMTGTPDTSSRTWFALEVTFTVIFSIELFLRALSERRLFFFGFERKWNMLDLFLVLLSLVDLLMTEASKMPNVSFARTLRVLRFTRILRVVRVMRFFQSFRLMVVSIINSLTSLLWVFLLVLFVIYFFASIFIHGVTEHFKDGTSSEWDQDLAFYFGTVVDALLVLFGSICGGMDWYDIFLPLKHLGWFYGSTFVLYIFFVMFGVLNVVVGTFVDTAYQASQRDRAYVIQCEVNRNKKYMEDIKTFFHEADSDRSGMLTLEEFETHLQKDKVKAYFQALELDISQARALFLLLDVDGSNEIELDEFIGGCMRMKGDAKSIDVNMLLYENEKMIAKWTTFMDYCTERFDVLESALVPEGDRRAASPIGPSSPASRSQLHLAASRSRDLDLLSKTSTRRNRLATALAALSQSPPSPVKDDGLF